MYPTSDESINKQTDDAVYFFTPAFHPLDNFSAHAVRLWDKVFPTAEHAFQWKKFSVTRPDVAARILAAPSPHAVKEIADAHKADVLASWYDERVAVMREILHAKGEQHEDVRDILKRTGKRRIVENSPVDNFWGAGPDGNGENMIGKIWMEIRDTGFKMS